MTKEKSTGPSKQQIYSQFRSVDMWIWPEVAHGVFVMGRLRCWYGWMHWMKTLDIDAYYLDTVHLLRTDPSPVPYEVGRVGLRA